MISSRRRLQDMNKGAKSKYHMYEMAKKIQNYILKGVLHIGLGHCQRDKDKYGSIITSYYF